MFRLPKILFLLLGFSFGLSAQIPLPGSGGGGGGASAFSGLSDVNAPTPTDGDGVRVDDSGDYVNVALFTPTTTNILAARMSGNVKSALETAVAASVLNLNGGFEVADFRCTAAAGVLTCQDPTAGIGVTNLSLNAGAGQGATPVFNVRNSLGTTKAFIDKDGVIEATRFSLGVFGRWSADQLSVRNTFHLVISSTTSSGSGFDVGLRRSDVGVMQISDGAAGYGQAYAKSFRANPDGTARPTCDSSARGTYWQTYGGAGVADTVAVCAKDAADAYDWRVIY